MTQKSSTLRVLTGSAASRAWFRLATVFISLLIACATDKALADEDGVSFWIPGFFGSLAAIPQQPMSRRAATLPWPAQSE